MPTAEEMSKIKNLAAEGKSVNKIKDRLELPKSTVYYHFKKEVGQKQKKNALKVPDDAEFKGELCGVFAGDGSHYYDRNKTCHDIMVHLNQKEEYWKILRNHLERKLGKTPFIHHTKEDSKTILKYISKPLYLTLDKHLNWEADKSRTVELDDEFSDEFEEGFLRGLIDTDGYMKPEGDRYRFITISKPLSEDICRILDNFKIDCTKYSYTDKRDNRRDTRYVKLYGAEAEKFRKFVKPRNPKRRV